MMTSTFKTGQVKICGRVSRADIVFCDILNLTHFENLETPTIISVIRSCVKLFGNIELLGLHDPMLFHHCRRQITWPLPEPWRITHLDAYLTELVHKLREHDTFAMVVFNLGFCHHFKRRAALLLA